ncbi:predicted protein [Chaetoceros tenuissimus]|uniref:Uncharacterized protein n=1 Tax=Chaetoceros tenuissimus TaxID=426638 RepID=A0AAD3H4C2_9STRA|nr:predicted protein [Chaetoceros tenuissimus]
MLLRAVMQALKAIVFKAVVTRPLLSAFRHVVSDWCRDKNTVDQEGEDRRVRRVRFAMDAKKEDGVLHPYGVWLSSPTRREVGGEVRDISKPPDYEDGNDVDWRQHHQEDLEKRASYWHLVKKKSPVFHECMALQRLLEKTQLVFWELEDKANAFDPKAVPFHYDYYVCKKDAVEKEFYALRQQLQQKQEGFFELEQKIDALDPEEGEEEPVQVQEAVQQENGQEGEGSRVRRVRFAMDAKKEDGVLEWSGVWTPSKILREEGGEVRDISMPPDYKDGSFGDWRQDQQEDLGKRASYWQNLSKRNSVENQWSDLERKINKLDNPESEEERIMVERLREKQRELEEVLSELEQKIDECLFIYPEGNTKELLEAEEIDEFAEVEAARWEDKKIEKKLGGEGVVIEDADRAEDMDVDMLDVQDQNEGEEYVVQQRKRKVSATVEELKELTVHSEFSSFIQIGSKRRKLEANPEHQESDSVETEVPILSPEVTIEIVAAEAAETAEEEPMQIQTEEQQDSDSIEVEELGSGFATDAAGRVRRFSHRLKGKSRRIYKF